ncbi:hypothetical protein [Kaistia nematophila]|uniref:Uncharacterized protein n=1 Tax=Kaistia nematophila TaxID=2994654 RepID=A0A9X3E475_9HYPH|nr:hypothetical protein [Kaistia nematophila]MCX5571479.1 hypothetical protein [Kaistia nematophila]
MLARIALRIAAIEALKGRTLVGDNVLDSQIGAIDVAADDSLRTDQERPFIAVYVDGSVIEERIDLRGLHKSGRTELTIEAGITAAMTETDPETGESTVIGIGIPATDPALELYLDCVGREIAMALSDPGNGWAEIWRGLSSSILKIERKRTSDAASGTRIAAHQLVITLDLLPDPVFGAPIAPTSAWAAFFAKMEDADHPFLVKLLELVGEDAAPSEVDITRRRFGLTLYEARALFIPEP